MHCLKLSKEKGTLSIAFVLLTWWPFLFLCLAIGLLLTGDFSHAFATAVDSTVLIVGAFHVLCNQFDMPLCSCFHFLLLHIYTYKFEGFRLFTVLYICIVAAPPRYCYIFILKLAFFLKRLDAQMHTTL